MFCFNKIMICIWGQGEMKVVRLRIGAGSRLIGKKSMLAS